MHGMEGTWSNPTCSTLQVQNVCPLDEELGTDPMPYDSFDVEGIVSERTDLSDLPEVTDQRSIVSGCSDYGDMNLEKITRPRTKKLSKQASGHAGITFLKQYSGIEDFKRGVPDFVLKAYDAEEESSYEKLSAFGDELQPFTAQCFGKVINDGGIEFLKLSNLLSDFQRGPHVMDCKIGVRSFTEEEVNNTKPRSDLYQRLVSLDSTYTSESENEAGACTKFRWMSFNDDFTTLRSLGFRIDGIANSSEGKVAKAVLHEARCLPKIANIIIDEFLPNINNSEGFDADLETQLRQREIGMRLSVVDSVIEQLEELLKLLRTSSFVAMHSIVGSSLLFAVDAHGTHARVFLIDLAKVTPLPAGCAITHSSPWEPGNHEDGLFVGVQNMIHCWENVREILEERQMCLMPSDT
eukprot:TRINITY_DN20213_c0_g1_i1.p1 TRINITY_DN20213_c0_g1~~TRINITY_DN20213_c0_g1_i1.p1  ORF type:complete len:409 (+),score=74.20 TRINITY_DN20213_c0_g1_i1:111-1337(+)